MSKVEYVVHGSPLLNDHFTCILGVCTISYESLKNQYDNLYIVGKQWEEACKQREEIVRECAKIHSKLVGHR